MEIPQPSRTCSISRRDFRPNESFFSVLMEKNGSFIRKDISVEHWSEPTEKFFGWWQSTAKHVADQTSQHVSGETLLNLFERFVAMPCEADTLYILTLLLLRRKLLRYEQEITDEQGNRLLEVHAFHTEMTYRILVAMPGRERLEVIQEQLAVLTNT